MDEARAASIQTKAAEEKALITKMDSAFTQRTPYIKSRLHFALNTLSDVEMLIRWEQETRPPQYAGMWLAAAEANISIAQNIRQQVQKLIDPVGDPSQIVEYPY